MFRIIMIAPHKIFIFLILEHFKIVSSRKLCLYNYLFFSFPKRTTYLANHLDPLQSTESIISKHNFP